ncbi:MAG: DUF4286 family protein [Bacteroidales bacterium]|nr:DUF4286 family protein [Bacteroidales bacterium]
MRVIQNTSFIIGPSFEKEWFRFIKEEYIPLIDQLDLCEDIIFTRVSIDQPEGKTYSLQLVFPNQTALDRYAAIYMDGIDATLIKKFSGKYLCFNSILREV